MILPVRVLLLSRYKPRATVAVDVLSVDPLLDWAPWECDVAPPASVAPPGGFLGGAAVAAVVLLALLLYHVRCHVRCNVHN